MHPSDVYMLLGADLNQWGHLVVVFMLGHLWVHGAQLFVHCYLLYIVLCKCIFALSRVKCYVTIYYPIMWNSVKHI